VHSQFLPVAVRIGDCDNDVKRAIASKFIELAKTGEVILIDYVRAL
jgi:hypothetical protein